MAFAIGNWRGGRTLVTHPDGNPRLWLDHEGELCATSGALTVYDENVVVDRCELASWVAEWVARTAEHDGAPIAYDDIHPDVRRLVLAMAPASVDRAARRRRSSTRRRSSAVARRHPMRRAARPEQRWLQSAEPRHRLRPQRND